MVTSIFRIKGHNAEAIASPKSHDFRTIIKDVFNEQDSDIKEMYNPTFEKVQRFMLNKSKDGDYGSVAFGWSKSYSDLSNSENGVAHTLNWMNEKGKVIFFDGQPNSIRGADMTDFVKRGLGSDKSFEFVNLTNAEIKSDAISGYSKIR